MILAKVIARVVATVLLTWLIGMYIKAHPAPKFRMRMSYHAAFERNNWIDQVGMYLCVLGLLSPLVLGLKAFKQNGGWSIGLMFGNMILLPAIWICSYTLYKGGKRRLLEFGKFYEAKYGISMKGILFAYGVLAIIGLVSIAAIIAKG